WPGATDCSGPDGPFVQKRKGTSAWQSCGGVCLRSFAADAQVSHCSFGGHIMFFQQFINGLAVGSIYALVAVGYSMVYGVLKLINFANNAFMVAGAFLIV